MSSRGNQHYGKQRYEEEDDYSYTGDEDCCLCITRGFVFYCNIALLFFGVAAMGYAIYLWATPDLEWAGDDLALSFTIFAAFLIIVALLGITGTWAEVYPCDLVVYLILIVSIVIAQVAFVIYTNTNEQNVKEYLEGIWDDWSDARKDEAMSAYECGLYHTSSFNVTGEDGIINEAPFDVANCTDSVIDMESMDYCFEDCYNEAKDAITTLGALTSTFLILFALLELMLMISSFILVCNPPDDYYSDDEIEEKPHDRHQRKDQAHLKGSPNPHQAYRNNPPQQNYYNQRVPQQPRRDLQMTRGHHVN